MRDHPALMKGEEKKRAMIIVTGKYDEGKKK
jgi:hypothetical protein